MEFSCRLVTARGEIVEGVYAAETEARLRHELEEKGLHVLSLQPRGFITGWSISLPRRRRIRPREFLEFNQELATLLKAGMPLVQSLDLLRSGVSDAVFRSVVFGELVMSARWPRRSSSSQRSPLPQGFPTLPPPSRAPIG